MAPTMGSDFKVSSIVNAIPPLKKYNCVWDVHKLHDHECKSVGAAGDEKTRTKSFYVVSLVVVPGNTMENGADGEQRKK